MQKNLVSCLKKTKTLYFKSPRWGHSRSDAIVFLFLFYRKIILKVLKKRRGADEVGGKAKNI
nr:MAG TPA: hypothetical protein [Caudoviricetes sp.]